MLAVALCFGGHRSTSSSKVSLSSSKAWLSSECPPWCTLHFIIKNAGAQMFAAPTALQFRVPGGQKAVNGVHGSLGSTQHKMHLSPMASKLQGMPSLFFFWLLLSFFLPCVCVCQCFLCGAVFLCQCFLCVCVCVLVLGRFKKKTNFFFVLGRDHHLSYGSFPSFWHT